MSDTRPEPPWEQEFDALVAAWDSGEIEASSLSSSTGPGPSGLRGVASLLAGSTGYEPITPPAWLRSQVLDPIRVEAGRITRDHAPASSVASVAAVVAPVAIEPRRLRGRRPIAAVAAAVAAIIAALVTFGGGSGTSVVFAADLSAAPGSPSPGASGTAELVSTKTGLVMRLRATGLAPNPTGAVYQCWYVGPEDGPTKQDRVAIGRFRTKSGSIDVSWPTAFDPKRYPKVGVTLEPDDGDPLRNGPKVLVGLPKGAAAKPA